MKNILLSFTIALLFASCGNVTPIVNGNVNRPIKLYINNELVKQYNIANISKQKWVAIRKSNSTINETTHQERFTLSDFMDSGQRTSVLNFTFEFYNPNRFLQPSDGEISGNIYQNIFYPAQNVDNPFEYNIRTSFENNFYFTLNNATYYTKDGTFKIKKTNNTDEYYIYYSGKCVKITGEIRNQLNPNQTAYPLVNVVLEGTGKMNGF